MKSFACLLVLTVAIIPTISISAQSSPHYDVIDSVRVGRVTGDFYGLDATNRRLYGAGYYIVNVDTKAVVDSFADSLAGGGFMFATTYGRGLTRNGLLFDLRTGHSLKQLPYAGDGSAYDASTGRAFLFGRDSATVVDMKTGTVVQRLVIPGTKESAVADGHGRVYASRESTNEIAVIDARTLRILASYSVLPGLHPTALAIDAQHERLFSACDSTLIVLDATNGRVVASLHMNGHSDQNAYDPETRLILMPNGKGGGLAVIHEDTPDHYTIAQNITDGRLTSVRVTVDTKTHRIFSPHRFTDGIFGYEVLNLTPATTSASADVHRP